MLTIQPHDSLNHLSSQMGQHMQKYRIFENLLGLRAVEVKKVDGEGSKIHPILLRLNDGPNRKNLDMKKISENTVSTYFMDGDEFVFKLTSFDKWVKVRISLLCNTLNLNVR